MTVAERLTGTEPPEVVERHLARYGKCVALADRTGGVWWDAACGTGYARPLSRGRLPNLIWPAFRWQLRFLCLPVPALMGCPQTAVSHDLSISDGPADDCRALGSP